MYQRRAEKRKLRFELTPDQFEKIIQQPCVFCGEQYDPRGVDRKDNRKGYLPENCQSCCGRCNNFKGARDQETWLAGILRIAKYQESLKIKKAAPPGPEPEQKLEPVPSPQPVKLLVAPSVDPTLDPQARRFLDTGRF